MKSYSFVSSFTKITCVAALALGTVVARAGYNPVALTPGSYTYAIVIPSNAAPPLPNAITATAGSGTTLGDNTYYEMTFRDPAPFVGFNSGIPAHGTVFTNLNNANMSFVMPPSYVTNNDLMIVNGGYGIITNGTLTFASPVTATSLAFLTTGGNNGCTFNYYILNTDGTTNTSGSLAVPD